MRAVNEIAFARPDEADLVEALHAEGVVLVSLVADVKKQVVGHILFTRMFVDAVPAVALAPMAVLPAYQRQGIGHQLIEHGLDRLRELGEEIVIVLGHPDYYPRFGFSTEMARSITSPFPPEAFMAMELRPGTLKDVRGPVKYPGAFGL